MSTILQIALFLASVAVVAFVLFLIPQFIGLRRYAAHAIRQLDELNADLKLLVLDSRAMVQNVDKLTSRAHQQLDEVDTIVRMVRVWSECANRIVEEVSDVVEAPISRVTRIISIVHKGLSTLLAAVAKNDHQPERKVTEEPQRRPVLRRPTVSRARIRNE